MRTATDLVRVDLNEHEQSALAQLAMQLVTQAAEAPDSLASLMAPAIGLLPQVFVDLRARITQEPPESAGWLVRGLPIFTERLGPTPPSWHACSANPTLEDCQLLLIGQALGWVFGWEDQQGGAIVHNIVPSMGDENSLLSSSSTTELTLHTEDAYFPERADLLLLLCLRNPSHAATYLADVREVVLSDNHARLVRESRYFFKPDGSHGQGGPRRPSWGFPVVPAGPSLAGPSSALVGCSELDPWLRCDIDYIEADGDNLAMEAAHALSQALYDSRSEVVLEPGDLLIIDNVRSVHGRGPFQPSFASEERRWLKRVNLHLYKR